MRDPIFIAVEAYVFMKSRYPPHFCDFLDAIFLEWPFKSVENPIDQFDSNRSKFIDLILDL